MAAVCSVIPLSFAWSWLWTVWLRPPLPAIYRPRDIAKQCELARTVDQLEWQARGCFRVFAQVSGLGCIDLGDRRSRVQISVARQTNLKFTLNGLRTTRILAR